MLCNEHKMSNIHDTRSIDIAFRCPFHANIGIYTSYLFWSLIIGLRLSSEHLSQLTPIHGQHTEWWGYPPIHGQHTEFRVFWVISLNKLLVLYRSQYMRAFQLIVSTLLWAYLLASQLSTIQISLNLQRSMYCSLIWTSKFTNEQHQKATSFMPISGHVFS